MANPPNRDPAVLRSRAARRWGPRAHWQCVYCGRTKAEAGTDLQVDHFQPFIIAIVAGSESVNLVPACPQCNGEKLDRDPWAWMAAVGVPEYTRQVLREVRHIDTWRKPVWLTLPRATLDYAAGRAVSRLSG